MNHVSFQGGYHKNIYSSSQNHREKWVLLILVSFHLGQFSTEPWLWEKGYQKKNNHSCSEIYHPSTWMLHCLSHTIRVWHIHLHLVDFYGKCRKIYLTWMLHCLSHTIRVWHIHLHLVDFYGKCRKIYLTWMLHCFCFIVFSQQNQFPLSPADLTAVISARKLFSTCSEVFKVLVEPTHVKNMRNHLFTHVQVTWKLSWKLCGKTHH